MFKHSNGRGRGGSKTNPPRPQPPYTIPGEDVDTNINQVKQSILAHANLVLNSDTSGTLNLNRVNTRCGLRADFVKPDANARIATNFFTLTPPAHLHVYKVEMIRVVGQGGNRPIKVAKYSDKMAVMQELQLSNTHRVNELNQLPITWATDGDLIYSTTPLFQAGQVGAIGQNAVVRNAVQYFNECGVALNVAQVNIRHQQTINPNLPVSQLFYDPAATSFRSSVPGILMRGLNAFLLAHARNQPNTTIIGGNRCYDNTRPRPLGQVLLGLQGFFLSARPGIDRLLVNVNNVCTPFIRRQTVHDFLRQSQRGVNQLRGTLKGVEVSIRYKPRTAYARPEDCNRFIVNIGEEIQNENCLPSQGQPAISVYNWYINPSPQHRQHALFPIPALKSSNPHPDIVPTERAIQVARSAMTNPPTLRTEWFPASQLNILPHQPYHGDLRPDETNLMIQIAQPPPPENAQRIIQDGLPMFGLLGPNALQNQAGLTTFGNMRTGTRMLTIRGQWLPHPTIRYTQQGWNGPPQSPQRYVSVNNVRNVSWNLLVANHAVHFATSRRMAYLGVINLTSYTLNGHQGYNALLGTMSTALRNHNLLTPAVAHFGWRVVACANYAIWSERIQYEDNLQTALTVIPPTDRRESILVTLRDKDYDVYASLKRVCELRLGIKTIFCKTDAPMNAQKASNIALKFNLKAADDNHHLDDTDLAAIRPARGQQCNTIVIGADVTHPGVGSTPGTPSIAAVVGTTDDNFMKFPGSMRLQRGRKEEIVELGDMVKERLIDWAQAHNGRLPGCMLFYRDGVSESQYEKLRTFEMPQIQQAYNWAREYLNWRNAGSQPPGVTGPVTHANQPNALDPQREPWPQTMPIPHPLPANTEIEDHEDLFHDATGITETFQLTHIVVGKRHNTRFYPMRVQDSIGGNNGNVNPGLVIDQVITHPFAFDFYLQSHNPLKGTGRSAHYFVLRNDMSLGTQEIINVTHGFCYAYARATRGVSYCAPAYYADRLCDRGRAYLRHFLTRKTAFNTANIYQQYTARITQGPGQQTFKQYNELAKNWLRDQPYYRPFHSVGYPTGPAPQAGAPVPTGPIPMKYGFTRRNPWHESLDNIMFYL